MPEPKKLLIRTRDQAFKVSVLSSLRAITRILEVHDKMGLNGTMMADINAITMQVTELGEKVVAEIEADNALYNSLEGSDK